MALKNRKITETDRAFYKLGFQDGERQLKRTIVLLKTTNRALWDELTRLDEARPVTGVLISFEGARRLVKALKRPTTSYYQATKLNKLLKKAKAQIAFLDTITNRE